MYDRTWNGNLPKNTGPCHPPGGEDTLYNNTSSPYDMGCTTNENIKYGTYMCEMNDSGGFDYTGTWQKCNKKEGCGKPRYRGAPYHGFAYCNEPSEDRYHPLGEYVVPAWGDLSYNDMKVTPHCYYSTDGTYGYTTCNKTTPTDIKIPITRIVFPSGSQYRTVGVAVRGSCAGGTCNFYNSDIKVDKSDIPYEPLDNKGMNSTPGLVQF